MFYQEKTMAGLTSILIGVTSIATPRLGFSQEIPYDYHHASSCFGHAGARADSVVQGIPGYPAGYVYSVSPGTLVCPIPRIYPRHPGRLIQVQIDLETAQATWDDRLISICSLDVDKDPPVCTTQTVNGAGRQKVVFSQDVLQGVIHVPYGWDQYMFLTIDQKVGDKLFGYSVDFNLNQ